MAWTEELKAQERSLSWLARKTGFSSGHLSGIARGERVASEPVRLAIAEALGRPVEELFPELAVA